jgi:hypothetical protein
VIVLARRAPEGAAASDRAERRDLSVQPAAHADLPRDAARRPRRS